MASNAWLDITGMPSLMEITEATKGRIVFWCHPALPYDCAVMASVDGDLIHAVEICTRTRNGEISIDVVTARLPTFDTVKNMLVILHDTYGKENVYFKWCD